MTNVLICHDLTLLMLMHIHPDCFGLDGSFTNYKVKGSIPDSSGPQYTEPILAPPVCECVQMFSFPAV